MLQIDNMVNLTAVLALVSPAVPVLAGPNLAPSPHPPPGPSSQGEEIIRQFVELSRSTRWSLVDKIKFEGDTFEPEGMTRLGNDRYFVSAFERPALDLRDNSASDSGAQGEGLAHMLVFDGKGVQLADVIITEPGHLESHIGGIDYDGTYIWATLAQNRPDSTATLVRMPPDTLKPAPLLRTKDHMGAAVHDLSTGNILTLNWGSRAASVWNLRYKPEAPPAFTSPRAVAKNPSHYTDYQDCKFLGRSQRYGFRPVMLCSGITELYGTFIGGIALVDMESMIPLYELPLTMLSDLGTLVTKNPMDVALVDGKMRLLFLPDERNSTLYAYEPV
ncbi:hypothetical protein VTK26DRAFT_7551 [Humicola hyalothermophila]